MRLTSVILVLITLCDNLNAHPLGSDSSLGAQLTHQLLSLHHLPFAILLMVGGFILVRKLQKHRQEK
ncbi:MAG: hypothetical protein R3192_06200 [Woeseiaceae bacterium]|nr:hypothetical protein [Woeseiaceae bacterium]